MLRMSAIGSTTKPEGQTMLPNKKHQDAGRSIFMSSVQGLANTLAVVVTFFGAPPLYSKSVGWIQSFTTQHYGYGFEDITSIIWAALAPP